MIFPYSIISFLKYICTSTPENKIILTKWMVVSMTVKSQYQLENPPLREIWALKWGNGNRISNDFLKIYDQVSVVKSVQNLLEIYRHICCYIVRRYELNIYSMMIKSILFWKLNFQQVKTQLFIKRVMCNYLIWCHIFETFWDHV